jgi:hypothetical protein
MSRLPKPDFLVQWEEWIAAGPPRSCHSCDAYDMNGNCMTFKMRPPDEFVLTQDNCPCWERICPF